MGVRWGWNEGVGLWLEVGGGGGYLRDQVVAPVLDVFP